MTYFGWMRPPDWMIMKSSQFVIIMQTGGIVSPSTFHRHQIVLSSVQFINYNCDLCIHYFCFHHRFKLVWMRQCARILGVIIQSISKIKHLNILMLYLWTLEHITRKRTFAAHLVLWFDVMSFWSACERLLFVCYSLWTLHQSVGHKQMLIFV